MENLGERLAIVIPAYKLEFFKQTVESIANQTCKEFTLYIGNDASSTNFALIADFYRDSINIVYKRFEENLGRLDLVAHWERCIDMIQDEQWVWLFSDDDLMENNCVELFYNHIRGHKSNGLLHFNIDIINENGLEIFKKKRFPSHFLTSEYFANSINGRVYSCVVEFIFKRELFDQVNGFEAFDLGWSSDTATWMKLSLNSGITTIDGAYVKWRLSKINISAKSNDSDIVQRKINASVEFIIWSENFFKKNNLVDLPSEVQRFRWLLAGIVYNTTLNFKERYVIVINIWKRLGLGHLTKSKVLLLWLYEEFKRRFKLVINYIGN